MPRRFWIFLGLIILIVATNLSLYSCTNSDCVARGGHTEIIWGNHFQWVCEGAHG